MGAPTGTLVMSIRELQLPEKGFRMTKSLAQAALSKDHPS